MYPTPASIPRADRWKLFAVFLAIGFFMAVIVLLVMAKIHEEIAQPFLERIDQQGMQEVHAHASPGLTRLARLLSWIGSPATLVPIISVSAVVLWLVGWKRDASLLILGIGGSGALDIALKLHFRRVRPPRSHGPSSRSTAFPFPADTPSLPSSSMAASPTSSGDICIIYGSAPL